MGEYLGGAGEAITALADGDVEHELLDLDLPHVSKHLSLLTSFFVFKIFSSFILMQIPLECSRII